MATPEGGLQHDSAVLGAVSGVSPTNAAAHFEVEFFGASEVQVLVASPRVAV